MKLSILTLFPDLFRDFCAAPVVARAIRNGAVEVDPIDIKTFAGGSFRHIDDSTFGGGTGMVMRVDPVVKAIAHAKEGCCGKTLTVALTPRGVPFTQKAAHDLASYDHLILVCGHYEGMDERIYHHVDCEISIGDYILTGGELAAQVVSDAIIRLLPSVLKHSATQDESFENGLLEYPQYTQPADYFGDKVPDVLLSGNHAAIAKWRHDEALRLTKERRPDLLP